MRIKAIALTLATVLLAITSLSLAQKKGSTQTTTSGGVQTTTFDTPHGKIKVSLPDDMAAGDTISGTVTEEPSGKNEKEKQQNSGELNGYVIELENQKAPVSSGVMRRVALAPGMSAPSLILLDKKGKQVAATAITVLPSAAATTPQTFNLPTLGQTGRAIQVQGPFDGNSANTTANVGGREATVIAESPRKLVFESPRDVVGPTEIKVTENGSTTSGQFRNLKIDLTAPKTSLLKGESTELHVQVYGLEGIREPIPITLQNQSPSTVEVSGGNTQTIPIELEQVQTGGIFTWDGSITATVPGSFAIVATVPSEVYLSPNPETSPTPSKSGSPPPNATPTATTPCKCENVEIKVNNYDVKVDVVNAIYRADVNGNKVPFGLELTASLTFHHKLNCAGGAHPQNSCFAKVTWTVDPSNVQIIKFDKNAKNDDDKWSYSEDENGIVDLAAAEAEVEKAKEEAKQKAADEAKKKAVPNPRNPRGKKPPAQNPPAPNPPDPPPPDVFFRMIPRQEFEKYDLLKLLNQPISYQPGGVDKALVMESKYVCYFEDDYTVTRHFVVKLPKSYLAALSKVRRGQNLALTQKLKFDIAWSPSVEPSNCPIVPVDKELHFPLRLKAQFTERQLNFFRGDW